MAKFKKVSSSHSPIKTKTKKFKFSLSISSNKHKKSIKVKIKNPKITAINQNSRFIYDIDTFEKYFSKLNNKNNLKLNNEEIDFLKSKIEQISIFYDKNTNNNNITIPLTVFQKINSFIPKLNEENEETLYIKKLLDTQQNKGFLSCRRISEKYFLDTGKKMSKTKVNNILRNKLNYRFLKSTIKNSKINNNRNILVSLCFIKIIIKCLKLNYKLIFVDESSIQCNNNNFKTWRKPDQTIYYNIGSTKKKNLIATVDENSIIHYMINDENTNENCFLKFMDELKNKIIEKNITQYVIILDNLSCHKTTLLKKYYVENKINILFNTPYNSPFNCIELMFRLIKRKIYQKLYSSTDEVVEEMKTILENPLLKSSLELNFKETLTIYYKYSLDHKHINLNNFDYE